MKNIKFFYSDTDPFNYSKNKIKSGVKDLIEKESGIVGDINIIFCSDQYLLKINREYLKHDFYTDIITFDYVVKNIISGDLFISIERIEENSKEYQISFEEELIRVIFHGILHLCGYEDKSENDKETMRSKENYYLGQAGFKTF